MIINALYKNRFNDTKKRKVMWKILVTNFFQKYIDNKDIVLDIPCGYCEFINNIKCYKKIAIDINKNSQKYANKDVKFILTPSWKTNLKDESINKIFISNFFEHLKRKDIIRTVIELKRILKKDGWILILQPNIRFCQKNYWMFFDHITPIDDRALDEVFEINGFKCIKKIKKFLPYTTKSKLPQSYLFIRLYLKFSFFWQIFGKQSFIIYKKYS